MNTITPKEAESQIDFIYRLKEEAGVKLTWEVIKNIDYPEFTDFPDWLDFEEYPNPNKLVAIVQHGGRGGQFIFELGFNSDKRAAVKDNSRGMYNGNWVGPLWHAVLLADNHFWEIEEGYGKPMY